MEAGPGGGVTEVVRLINATPSLIYPPKGAGGDAGSGNESDDGGTTRKISSAKKTKRKAAGAEASNGFSRPVICICNDAYAPALRDLRPLAQVCVDMVQVSSDENPFHHDFHPNTPFT